MRTRSSVTRSAIVLALALLWAGPAAADGVPIGGSCNGTDTYAAAWTYGGNNEWCNGSVYAFPAYQLGSTTSGCGSSTAGLMQWTGSSVTPNNTLEYCNGLSWTVVNGAATTVPLSGITAATGSQTFDSGNWAQTWEWGTLTTQTALTLTTSSMTGGTLLSLQDTAAAATSTGKVLSVTDASTGTGYGIYSAMTATANTGYAGYFNNTATSGANYGVYGSNASPSGYGGYFTNTSTGWALSATGTSYFNGSVGIGTASPADALHIVGTGFPIGGDDFVTGILRLQSNGGGIGAGFDMENQAGHLWGIFNGDSSSWVGANVLGFYYASAENSSDVKMVILSSGYVGIGTVSPGALLEVNGNAQVDGNINIATSTKALQLGGTNVLTYPNSGNDASSWADGPYALNSQTGGSLQNTAVGYSALYNDNSAPYNTAVGWEALYNTTSSGGGHNTGLGWSAGSNISTGTFNVAVGNIAMAQGATQITGNNNTAVGGWALDLMAGGAGNNTAVGNSALYSMTTGNSNTAVGTQALEYMTGSGPGTAVGAIAGQNISTGTYNVAIGSSSMAGGASPITGSYNVAVGDYALNSEAGGTNDNTAVGYSALYSLTTGQYNTALGYEAGYVGTALTVGTFNTFLGYEAQANANNYTNSTALGNQAVITASNQIVLGNSSVTQVVTFGSVGIGTTNPNEPLELYTTTTGGLDFEMNDAASGGAIWTMIVADNGNSAENGTLNFVYNGNASNQGALAMTQTDSIGISNNGYASIPTHLFDVMGNSDTRIDVGSSDTSSGNYTGFQISNNETGSFQGGILINNSNKSVVELWDSSDVLNLTSTGSVGIGTTTPRTALDLATTGVVLAGNSVYLTSATTDSTTTTQESTGLVLPTIPGSTVVRGHCTLIWEKSAGPGTTTFAIVTSAAPTGLWVVANTVLSGATVLAPTYTAITTAATTNVTSALTATATGTAQFTYMDFVLSTAAATPVALTIDGNTSAGADHLLTEPGSACGWEP